MHRPSFLASVPILVLGAACALTACSAPDRGAEADGSAPETSEYGLDSANVAWSRDLTGYELWGSENTGHPASIWAQGRSVALSADGNILLGALCETTGGGVATIDRASRAIVREQTTGPDDLWGMKADGAGGFLARTRAGLERRNAAGDRMWLRPTTSGFAVNAAGSVVTLENGPSYASYRVIGLDAAGNATWEHQGSVPAYSDTVQIAVAPDGHVVILEDEHNSPTRLLALDTTGALLWEQALADGGPRRLVVDETGNIFVVQRTPSDWEGTTYGRRIEHFDAAGHTTCVAELGGDEPPLHRNELRTRALAPLHGGGLAIGGVRNWPSASYHGFVNEPRSRPGVFAAAIGPDCATRWIAYERGHDTTGSVDVSGVTSDDREVIVAGTYLSKAFLVAFKAQPQPPQ